MKTKSYTVEFSMIVKCTFACLLFAFVFSFSANGQNPLLKDADLTTPFSNCDLLPTKLKPDYKLVVNNVSTNIANIASYKISWGDGSTDGPYPANFTSATHTYLSLGIFSLVFTAIDNAGVETVKSYSVSNQSNPAIGISNNGGNTIGCSPLALSFTITEAANNAPGTYYEIDYGDGSAIETKTLQQVLDNNVINHVYTNSSCDPPGVNGQFTLKVKAINSCTATPANMGAIIVYKSPIPKFSTSVNDNGCINTAISFTNQTKSGSGYNCNSSSDIYLWTFGDGNTSTDKNPTHTYTVSGKYSVSLTSSNGQCVSVKTTIPLPLCISPKPTADFTLPTPSVCKGTVVSVVNNSITENTCGNLKYVWTVDNYLGSVDCLPNAKVWNFSTGFDINSANPSFVFANAGTYRINLTVSNGCGTISTYKTITVKQAPSVKINPVNAICVNQSITPTALVNNCFGATGSTYDWQFTGGEPSVSTSEVPSAITYSTAGTYDILLSATNECGTSVALPVKLTVNDYPIPVISGPAVVCSGSKGNVYTTAAGMTNYQWVVSAGGVITSGNTTTSNSITVDWNSSDNQTVSLNYSQFGCPSQTPSVLNVSVNPLPVPFAGDPATICSGEPVQLGVAANAGSSYRWISIPAGFVSTESNPTVRPLQTTEYILTETTVLTGCSASNSVIVTVNPLPVPSINGPAAVCIGSEDVVYTAGAGMTNYQWTVSPGGTITAGGTFSSNTISVTWNQEGNQFISLNYTNDKGCTAAVPLVYNVSVNTSQIVVLEGSENICEQSSGSIYTALPGMTNYDWDISSDFELISGGDAVSNTAEIKWNSSGAKTVSVIYTQPGCVTTTPAVVNVNVKPRSTPVITGESTACAGSVNVNYATETGMLNYKWEISAGGNITSGKGTSEIKVTWNTPGNQFVKVNYEGSSVCPSLIPSIYNITVNELQIPTIEGLLETCQGLNAVEYVTEPGMSDYSWKVSDGGTISAGSETDHISVVWKTAGGQNVSVSYLNNSGCSSTDEVKISVKVNSSPTITAFPSTLEICSGSLATIQLAPSDGTVTYSWSAETISGTVSGAASGTGSTIAQQLINTETTVAIVRYTILSSNGTCAGTPVFAEVKVRNLSPTITGLSNSCARTKGVIYKTEPGMDDYNWIVSSGGSIKSGVGTNSITVDWYIVGDQTVSVSYGNSAGCTGNSVAVYSVKVNPLPSITIASPTVVCAGSPVTFTTEAGMSDYRWIADEGVTVADGTSASNSITVLWNNPGSYLMTVNYANDDGCSASSPLMTEIIVLPVPSPTLSGPQNVCANSGSILYLTQPGKVKYSWMISGGQIISGGSLTSNSATVVWDNSSDHSIRVNYSNGECMAPNPAILKVNVNATPSFTVSEVSGCKPLTVTFKNTTTAGADNYTWDFNDGTKYTTVNADEEVTHTFMNELAVAKTFVVRLTSSSESGCMMTSEQDIKVEPAYSVGSPISQKGCSPYEVKFDNAYPGSKSYSWQAEDGTVLSTESNPTLTFNAIDGKATTYIVRLVGESFSGCTATVNNTITVFPLPKAGFTQSAIEGCSPLFVKFRNRSSDGAKTYAWDFGDGSASVSLADPDYTFISPNGKEELYNVTLSARNEFGCVETYKSVVKVFPTPQADFSVHPLEQTMPSKNVLLTNLTKFSPWSYTWQFGDGTAAQTGDVTEHEYSKAGYYTISLTATGDVCSSTKKIGVTINDGAPGTAFDCETEGCAPFSLKFTNNSVNGFKFLWDFGNGNHSTEFEPKITYFEGGTYNVRLEVYNNLGEMTFSEKVITVHDEPIAFFRASAKKVRIPGNNVFFVNLSENANTLIWDFGDGTTSTDFEPVHEYSRTGIFSVSLKITSAFNCTDEFLQTPGIEIYSEEIKIANAFIPTKDGSSGGIYITGDPRNHIFHPNLANGDVDEYELQIFNRWGNLVFQSNEVERGWDGYFNGKLCSQDVYVWKIKLRFLNGEQITKVGDVTLIQ